MRECSMISVKDAVNAALDWAREIYADTELQHLRVEEIKLSEDEKAWSITLGWIEPAVRSNAVTLANINGTLQKLPRVYKIFEVDAETGSVRSMQIRQVDE